MNHNVRKLSFKISKNRPDIEFNENMLNPMSDKIIYLGDRISTHSFSDIVIFDNKFKNYLKKVRAYSIDMETATLFTVGFHNRIPIGALLLVTDQPMIPEGIKTQANDNVNSALFDKKHLKLGIESLKQIINNEDTVRHLKF